MQFNSSKVKKKIELQKIIVYIAIVVAFLVFSITLGDAGFLTVNNQINILRQMTTIGIMSFGMTFVIGCQWTDFSLYRITIIFDNYRYTDYFKWCVYGISKFKFHSDL